MTSLQLNNFDEYEVKKKKINLHDYFMIIGAGKMNALDLLIQLKPNTQKVIVDISHKRDIVTNEVIMVTTELTKSQKVQLSRSLGELISHDIIKKIGRNQYIVNPYFYFPKKENVNKIIDKYLNI